MLPTLATIREGSTDLLVPAASLTAKDPETFPAFFNPAARVNRDVSVAVARATRPATFLDALAGIGARGVRVAREAGRVEATLVEFNKVSLEIVKRNARRNRVASRCEVVREEANAYLHSRFGRLERFEAVDVDPFGTPAPFVQGALGAASDGGIVSLTATDTATLCGVFPSVAMRRYGARVTKSESPHEAAIRVLFGFCARVGGSVDIGITPVAAHSTLHYLRVYFRVARGATKSDRALAEVGYVSKCGSCNERAVTREPVERCPGCGQSAASVGPQWTGSLVDEQMVSKAAEVCSEEGWAGAREALASLSGMDELPPYGYSMEAVTSREGVSSVSLQRVVEALRASGRSAMRQPFGGHGVKTDATYAELSAVVRDAAGLARQR